MPDFLPSPATVGVVLLVTLTVVGTFRFIRRRFIETAEKLKNHATVGPKSR